jgi:hypothetical protein
MPGVSQALSPDYSGNLAGSLTRFFYAIKILSFMIAQKY